MDIQAYIQSGVVESYVLGLATNEEAVEIESLRLQYPEVEKGINDFSSALEQHALRNSLTPPNLLKDKILAVIKEEKGSRHFVPMSAEATPVWSLKMWKYAAAASIILFIASAGINFYLYGQYQDKDSDYQALLNERNILAADNQIFRTSIHQWQSTAQMMADPGMAMVKMKDPKKKEQNMATLFWDTRNKDVYVMPNKLPQPKQGKQYQLWAIVKGKPVDAGMLEDECNGVCKMKNIPSAEAFAITLEKQGGSANPTMSEMYVMGSI